MDQKKTSGIRVSAAGDVVIGMMPAELRDEVSERAARVARGETNEPHRCARCSRGAR